MHFENYPNIVFRQVDFQNSNAFGSSICDSVSCLHAIEHFGLGRYGDPIDPEGHIKGLVNLWKLLEPGGKLYVSCPIGKKNEVHFNAHRIFEPMSILTWAPELELKLANFDFADDSGELRKGTDRILSEVNFGLGIYEFIKG